MPRFIDEFDFQNILLPHGEDSVSFLYVDGDLVLSVLFNDAAKELRMRFVHCRYQLYSVVPGAGLLKEKLNFSDSEAGRIYRIEGSKTLFECASASIEFGTPFRGQHFYCYFDSFNVDFHIIADKFVCEVI